MKKVLIHIGYPKSASSSLQHYFSELKENSGISYYDALSFGWQAVFDNDYELLLTLL